MSKLKRRSDCAINYVLELFGDRWTFLIVRDLMFQGKHRYGEFLQSEEGIATNILADRLALLEGQRIVVKSIDPSHASKLIYKLTDKGIDLLPMLLEYIAWSAKYDRESGVDMKFVKRIRKDKQAVIEEISNRLRSERKR